MKTLSGCVLRHAVFCAVGLAGAVTNGEGVDVVDGFLFQDEATFVRSMDELPGGPRLTWFDEPEVRVTPEVDADDLWTHTYSLRFRPAGRGERRLTKDLFAIENRLQQLQWTERFGDELTGRYERLIELALAEARLAVTTEERGLDAQLLDAERALATTRDFDAGRVQEAVLRLERREREVRELRALAQALRDAGLGSALQVAAPTPRLSSRLMNPERVAQVVKAIDAAPAGAAPRRQRVELERSRAEHEAALARNQSRFGVNFFELSFENKGIDSYNLTLGIRIPHRNRSLGAQRRLRDVIAAEHDAWFVQQTLDGRAVALQRRIELQARNHADVVRGLTALADQRGAGGLDPSGDPGTYAAVRRHELALLDSAVALHAGVLRDYVQLLQIVGSLQARPLTNKLRGDSM